MQNGQLPQAAHQPDPRMTTYSTASSIYPRESGYDFVPPAQPQSQSQSQAPTPAPLKNTPLKNTPSIVFPSAEILLAGEDGRNDTSSYGSDLPARKRRKPSLNDPIQTHLLLQTALGDSGQFEILSLEELESLKRETQSIRARINARQKKLALETKVRDAAKSLIRLRSPTSSASSSPKVSRTSSGLSKAAGEDKAQQEYAEAVKKCEDQARELYQLEQKEKQAQTRILQHTAGILQNTHHGYSKNSNLPFVPGGGRPDSPASLDGSVPRGPGFDGLAVYNDSSIYENMLENLSTVGGHKRSSSMGTSTQQREMISYLSAGLEDLNKRMAAVLARTNLTKAERYDSFPEVVDDAINVSFAQRLEQLTQGLEDIGLEQDMLKQEVQSQAKGGSEQLQKLQAGVAEVQVELQKSVQENVALQAQYDKMEATITAELGDLNGELYQLLTSNSMNVARAPADAGPMDSLQYTKAQVASIRNLVQASSTAINDKRQTDALLEGLWAFIIGAEEDLRSRKSKDREALAQKRNAGAQIDSEDEVSPDEDDGLGQEFSIQAFNTKVQWLVSQSLYLKEKQSSLRRKVKAHRERADRSLESVAGNEGLKEQLLKAEGLYANAQEELRTLESRTMQLQKAQEEKDARIKTLTSDIARVEADAREEAVAQAKAFEQDLQEAETKAAMLEAQLATVQQESHARSIADETNKKNEAQARSLADETAKKNEAEITDLRDEVVRLKTELTIAQAELDGAYGSRQQRAAEITAASNTEATQKLEALTATNADLAAKEAQLRKELAETLKEFEDLTKASVDSEREREELEGVVDKMRDKVEALEAQIAEDGVKWLGIVGKGGAADGEQSPGSSVGGGGAQSMSVVVLKNEFKKMMREARVESQKLLRAEQDERRRLEGVIRNLKKAGGSGKSSLSHIVNA